MAHSIFDLFKIGVGPSSSHTVGPMIVGNRFIELLKNSLAISETLNIQVNLYGSLALTGKGHLTDIACILGLLFQTPDQVDPDKIPVLLKNIEKTNNLPTCGYSNTAIKFNPENNIIFNFSEFLPQHLNGMTISALNGTGDVVLEQTYFSVGGGFVLHKKQLGQASNLTVLHPYPFENARELLQHCQKNQLTITQVVLANEKALGTKNITDKILGLWQVMAAYIERGIATDGVLPRSLKLKQRAYDMHQRLFKTESAEQFDTLDWVNLYAMAVNEEDAAEIGMEHNLGLTCDPINGLVQVPCIERNTMGALKALNTSRLAFQSDGIHHVHLDDVIKTMHQTGSNMMSKYKETSLGGLAINVVVC